MTSEQAIGMLDRQLARNGQSATISRLINGGPTYEQYACKCAPRTLTTSKGSNELANGVVQQYVAITFSPSDIPSNFGHLAGGPAWPTTGDIVTFNGEQREIKHPNPIKLNDVLVKIICELQG